MNEPTCGKCGLVMTPADSRLRPELFLHDACLPNSLKPQQSPHVTLWNAINEYAESCGGDTGVATIGDRRMNAVAAVEKALRAFTGA